MKKNKKKKNNVHNSNYRSVTYAGRVIIRVTYIQGKEVETCFKLGDMSH